MSTRGAVGFILDDKVYCMYNHSDSYPDWLGRRVLEDLKQLLNDVSVADLRKAVANLRVVHEGDTVTEADIVQYQEWFVELAGHADVGWYELLRELQGSLIGILEAGVLLDAGIEWCGNGLFNEYMYLVDLDEEILELYSGHLPGPCRGRFCDFPYRDYYVSLAGFITFEEIETQDIESLLQLMLVMYGEA